MRARTALCLLLALCSAGPVAAALITQLEPRVIDELETVRLTIRAVGTVQAEAPDLAPLLEDFEVLGNQTSSRISSVNGRTVASVQYQISLRPKRAGNLTVPSLSIGGERTEAIPLTVRPLEPSVKADIARMVFFETELSSNPVYVQAETVFTRRLFYSQGVQIYSDLPGAPEVADAVVLPLGETQARSEVRDGRRYGVIEQRFAIFPERSGRLTIPAISVTSSVRLEAGGRSRRSGLRVSTRETNLEVRPIPASYPADAAWLPARDVRLTQRWEPDDSSVAVGEPLTFEVLVQAAGNRSSAIPPLPMPLPDQTFKIYPEAPVLEERTVDGSITGSRRERYALIPALPGRVAVPTLTITWWDTRADRLRSTRLAVTPLTITGNAVPAAPAREQPAPSPETAAPADPETGNGHRSPVWFLTPPLLLALLLAAWLARGRLGRKPRSRQGVWLALERARERRRRRRALLAATAAGDPAAYRRALQAYLRAALPHGERAGSDGAAVLATLRSYPGAAPLLRSLDRAVYAGTGEGAPVDTRALTALALACVRDQHPTGKQDTLPPLFA